jgi:hypothetical protein
MRAWQFDTATGLLDEATAVLEQRDTIDTAAADAGLTPPDSLRTTFEDEDGFADAQTEIDQQRNVITHYTDAVDSRPEHPDVFTQLGLWDATPERNLEAASKAYTAGDLEGAATDADDARLTWIGAASVGRTRAALIAAVVIGILLLLGLAVFAFVGCAATGASGRSRERPPLRHLPCPSRQRRPRPPTRTRPSSCIASTRPARSSPARPPIATGPWRGACGTLAPLRPGVRARAARGEDGMERLADTRAGAHR